MKNVTAIDSTKDILDVRDIIERYEELENERNEYSNEYSNEKIWAKKKPHDSEELTKIETLLNDMRGNGGDHEWRDAWYPVTLIRDSHFEDAMDEMLEEIGDMPAFDKIPSYLKITVNYEALQSDYSSVEYDGETYWYR